MRIIVDIMGGDKTPLETLTGVCRAADEQYAEGVDFTLVGNEGIIRQLAAQYELDIDRFMIVHASEVMKMTDNPLSIRREKKGTSMAVGLKLLHDGEGDAFVSCGNTGALYTGATLIVGKIKGVVRPAICSVLPMDKPLLLVDSGANISVNDEYLLHFALMGSSYAKVALGLERPAVGLINNGSEECKGTALQIEAYKRLSACDRLNFVGNIEGNAIPFGVCDVAVCDGFTGNVLLKNTEGLGKLMIGEMKKIFKANLLSRIAALLVKKRLMAFKKKFDSTEYGGAPILGVKKTVIKAHGSSDAKAFSNAIRQAIECEKAGVVDMITEEFAIYEAEKKAETHSESDSVMAAPQAAIDGGND